MADMNKRVTKKLKDRLGVGETVDAAILVETKGTYGLGVFALAALPGTTQRRLERQAQESRDQQLGSAKDFPTGSSVVVVTDRRVLVVPSNGLTFRDTALEVPRGELFVGEVSGKVLARRVQLLFWDGSGVEVDVNRGQNLTLFTEVLGRATV
jgi:hypothetical protein